MSSFASSSNRMWVHVMPSCKEPDRAAKVAALPAVIVADLVASGMGAIVKTAADRLIAADQYVVKTVLAYEPGFVIRANATTSSFLLTCITLNVGPKPIPVCDETTQRPLSFDVIAQSREYRQSPVVLRLEFEESADGTALAARVTRWKYTNFLDSSPTPFRTPRRKVTVEIKISDVDGTALLATAMQVEADSDMLPEVRPNDGERLPWVNRPLKNFSGQRILAKDQYFGPVNVEASITEVAQPSGFAKFLGATLRSQQAAIEGFVKDRVAQALDEAEAAKSRLASLNEASIARAEYSTAYREAVDAEKTLNATSDPAASSAARQMLTLKLATLRVKETLARVAFDRAGLAFEPLPPI